MRAERFVLAVTGAARIERVERVQSLWGGYGELSRVHLGGGASASVPTVIVKEARVPPGEVPGASHARKCRSYDVECAFYETYAAETDAACRVARSYGVDAGRGEWAIVLEDLDAAGFARRMRRPLGDELSACLGWLASFHARFFGRTPDALWPIGTYWHLATRQDELAVAIRRDPSLARRAPELDAQLAAARHRTVLHGDAKPANFCFAARATAGAPVAAVDFQYTGGGPGIVDVAYLLHGEAERTVEGALDAYFRTLRATLPPAVDGADVEREWRALYPVAVADFERFLLGWRG